MNEIIISFIIIVICLIIFWLIEYINKKNKINSLSEYSFKKPPKLIIKEEEQVTCILCLKKDYILTGQLNGMISVYSYNNFTPLALIVEHIEIITSLCELNDGTILSSSADGTLRKIRLKINENKDKKKKYLVEFVFYTNEQLIFKSIQIKNSDDILSCNITKELTLWKKTTGDELDLYKVNKILLKGEDVWDIFQINDKVFITCGKCLRCWDVKKYELIKKLDYYCRGSGAYKINDNITGIFLRKLGDILLFNNNELSAIKLINLSQFCLTSLKVLKNNTILVGVYDEKKKTSFINQYILNIEQNNSEEIKSNDINKIEMIKIKEEEVKYTDEDFYFDEFNWSRINTIEEIDDFVLLGVAGQEKLKNMGKLIIFDKNKW